MMRVLPLPCKHSTPRCGWRQKPSRSQHPKGTNATLHHPTARPTAPQKEHKRSNPKEQTQRGHHFGTVPSQRVTLRPRATQPNEAIAPSTGITPTHHPAAGPGQAAHAGLQEHWSSQLWLLCHDPPNAPPPSAPPRLKARRARSECLPFTKRKSQPRAANGRPGRADPTAHQWGNSPGQRGA